LRHRVAEILEMNEAEIGKLLEEHSNLFKDMRYRFESSRYSESFSVPLQFFYSLAKSLDQLAQETIGIIPYPWKEPLNVDIAYEELSMLLQF
jgi:plasmid maintenance system antidote protein VapI